MHANAQIFWNDLPAAGAALRCAFGVDFDECPTSSFRLVGQKVKEHRPCRIVDVFIENLVFAVDHLFGLQVFDKDRPEPVDYTPAEFVQKVFALVADLGVQAGKLLSGRTSAFFRMLSLKLFEFFFGLFQVLRIVYDFTVGQRGKGLDADVDTDFLSAGRKRLGHNFIAGKGRVEVPVLPLDSNGFDFAFQVPVQLNSDAANILDVELAVLNPDTITVRRERNRVEAVTALEPWESRLVITGFDSPEERLKRFVQASQNVLGSGIVELRNTFVKAADFFKRVGLVVIVDRLVPLVPAENALLKGAVVQKTGRIKEAFQLGFLGLVGEKPVFKCLTHLLAFLGFDVPLNGYFADMSDTASVITTAPKCWQFAAQFPEFLTQDSACVALQPVHDFGYASGRIVFKKQMNVIGHYFKGVNCKLKFRRFFTNQLLKSLRYYFGQHFAAIFRAPNNMQFQTKDGFGISGVSVHVSNIYMSDIYVNKFMTERSTGLSSAS